MLLPWCARLAARRDKFLTPDSVGFPRCRVRVPARGKGKAGCEAGGASSRPGRCRRTVSLHFSMHYREEDRLKRPKSLIVTPIQFCGAFKKKRIVDTFGRYRSLTTYDKKRSIAQTSFLRGFTLLCNSNHSSTMRRGGTPYFCMMNTSAPSPSTNSGHGIRGDGTKYFTTT